MTDFTGRCACGHVSYQMTTPPLIVHCCHCTSCQRESGTAFAVNALIETDRVEILSGATEEVVTPSESGKGQRVHRCPNCRVAIYSQYAMGNGLADKVKFVRVGTLDDPSAVPPDVHIFTRSKQPWVVLPEDQMAVDIYYKTEETWPAESLARRKVLIES